MRRFVVAGLLLLFAVASRADGPRVTILSDAFGKDAVLHKDWGYSALVEWNGRRVLFDAGNHADHLIENARRLDVDLGHLDFAIVSHRHGDHTNGLARIVALNPGLTIYVPDDEHFGGPTPPVFFRQPDPSLPAHMRYFDGAVPAVVPHGTVLPPAKYVRVGESLDIAPGLRLVANLSPGPAFAETPEVSLIVGEEEGRTLIVGCSHPGIERILESANANAQPVALLVGGLHLVTASRPEVERIARALRDEWKVEKIAPGHCSGEQTFSALRESFGANQIYAGVGESFTPDVREPLVPIGRDVTPPRILERRDCSVPSGGVCLSLLSAEVVIETDGSVSEVTLTRAGGSAGGRRLSAREAAEIADEHCVAAVKLWKFRPATRNGIPVRVAWSVSIVAKCQ